ncbi:MULTISPECIES: hypothetical protein [Bacillales]|uniref:Uncharacterized protein n=1 Tax=Lysinibacillus halotolerans TaxID=1368476 RepID=A0A3M8GYQ1_9BACI|nr:hypothetical protein [Lysinibacillus halotolerans]RNC95383.1 hypothetical protein EC501_18155 [Lysinibacillus halotolerans]
MNKKEMKQIQIVDVIANKLSGGSDITGECISNVDVDFIIDTPQEIVIFDKIYRIDRIKLLSSYDELVFRLASKTIIFEELEVSKIFVHKIYNLLNDLQSKGNLLSGWDFRDEVLEILSDNNRLSSINYREESGEVFGTLFVWGTDENGFWNQRYKCFQSEIENYLSKISNYEDYDFEFKYILY